MLSRLMAASSSTPSSSLVTGHWWSASPWSHLVGGCEAAGRWLHRATNLPSCHLPVCQTTCTQLYLDTISRRKFSHFLKMGKFTHILVSQMHEPVSTQYHQRDVCCHHDGHLHRYADHHHQCQLLCERRRMSTEVFTGGRFLFKLELFIHPTKGSPPASDSHHSMRYFRTPTNAELQIFKCFY